MSSWTERTSGQRRQMAGDDDPGQNQTTADSGAGTEIVPMPAELDLATSEGVPARGCAAIARLTRLVLLDLPGVSFCDARGLSAFVRIANQADAAGRDFGLLAPRPLAARILRIRGLNGSRKPGDFEKVN